MDLIVETKLRKFFSHFPLLKYRKGEVILRPEDYPQGVLYIKSGFVRMHHVFVNGKELTLNIFKPGSYFPVNWVIVNQINVYYFEAMTSVVVYKAPREKVIQFLKADTEVLFELTSRLIIGFFGLLSNIEHLLAANASQRITSILIILAKRFGKKTSNNRIIITLSLSHEDIARLANLTRETTSVEMKKLMDRKDIFYKRRFIVINNLKKLQRQLVIKDHLVEEESEI